MQPSLSHEMYRVYKEQSGNEKVTLGKRTSLLGQKQEQALMLPVSVSLPMQDRKDRNSKELFERFLYCWWWLLIMIID